MTKAKRSKRAIKSTERNTLYVFEKYYLLLIITSIEASDFYQQILTKTIDPAHWTVYQRRRCFLYNRRYFRIDQYEEPCNPSCRGLVILSTRSVGTDLELPNFLQIEKDITHDLFYSMFNLSLKAAPNGSSKPTWTSST